MAEPESACPRCGSVTLDEATRAQLRARYTGCLCLGCLRELASRPDPETVR